MGEYSIKELFVEVTNYCLQGCIHCSSCAGPLNFQSIPIERLRSLIEEAIPMGLESFTISGGEPLLYPDLLPLISFINQKKLSFNLYTCGIGESIDKKIVPLSNELLDQLVSHNIKKLTFSLQGASPKIHERVSGLMGSYETTLESIRRAIYKKILVELHFVPMTVNWEEIESVVKIATELGITQVSLLRLVQQGRCDDSLMLSEARKAEFGPFVEELRVKYPTVNIRLGAPFNCVTLASKDCNAARDKLLISANGEVFPCEAFKFKKGTRPTIYNKTIRDIWENDKLLNDIRSTDQTGIEYCNDCYLYSACKAGCAGQRERSTGNLFIGPDPDCLVAKRNILYKA